MQPEQDNASETRTPADAHTSTPADARTQLAIMLDGWQLIATRIPTRNRGTEWDKRALHFHCAVIAPRGNWAGEYSVGSAVPAYEYLRAVKAGMGVRLPAPKLVDVQRIAHGGVRTLSDQEVSEYLAAWYKPALVDVVSSLLLDASGADASFRDWCTDFGFEGNPADALESYNACVRAREFLLTVLGRDGFDKASELAREM